jgi:ABC-type multidrug transport system permease subunit
LASVGLTWIAIGIHSFYGYRWIFPRALVVFIIAAIVSGAIGMLLAHGAARGTKAAFPKIKMGAD